MVLYIGVKIVIFWWCGGAASIWLWRVLLAFGRVLNVLWALYYGDTEMNVVAMNEGFWCGWWRLMGEMVRWVMLWNGAVEDNVALFGMLLLFTYLISSI